MTGSIYTADTLVRQRRLARKTVRLHVIANSDEAADQAQKLRVRDGVLACVSGLTADCETADDARECIAAHLPEIAEAAQRVLAGSGYDVTVSLGPETYGTRDYASFSLPAGTYPSLRVQIGEAAGKNWWCVVFPTLCTAATSDEAELQGRREVLTRTRLHGSRRSSRNTACASKRSSGSRSSKNCFHEPALNAVTRLSACQKSPVELFRQAAIRIAKSIFAA